MEPILLIPKTISANRVAYWEPVPRPCHKERKEVFPKHLSQIIEHVCETHVPATSQSIFYGGLCFLWDGFYSRFLCMPQNVKDFNNANSMLWHWTSFCPRQPNNPIRSFVSFASLFNADFCAVCTTHHNCDLSEQWDLRVCQSNVNAAGYFKKALLLGIFKNSCLRVFSKTESHVHQPAENCSRHLS